MPSRDSDDSAVPQDCLLKTLSSPELDAAFWPPSRLGTLSAWWGHVPFMHWLVSSLRPGLAVELGTHGGVSFAALCEAMQRADVPGRCFAIDTWKGDRHSGFYDESVYEDVVAFVAARYGAFAELVRLSFDDALPCFADGSVDLLHIDGLHTFEAVRADFENWRPKLTQRGVVLFHDTNVRRDDFGVWKLWAELRHAYPSFEFLHGHGLGILAVGPQVPHVIKDLCSLDPAAGSALKDRFAQLGARWVAAYAAARSSRQVEDPAAAQARLASDQQRTADLDAERSRLADLSEAQGRRIAELEGECERAVVACTAQARSVAELQAEREQLAKLSQAQEEQVAYLQAERERQTEFAARQDRRIAELEAERGHLAELSARQGRQAADLHAERERLAARLEEQERRIALLESERAEWAQFSTAQGKRVAKLRAEHERLAELSTAQSRRITDLEAEGARLAELAAAESEHVAELEGERDRMAELSTTQFQYIADLESARAFGEAPTAAEPARAPAGRIGALIRSWPAIDRLARRRPASRDDDVNGAAGEAGLVDLTPPWEVDATAPGGLLDGSDGADRTDMDANTTSSLQLIPGLDALGDDLPVPDHREARTQEAEAYRASDLAAHKKALRSKLAKALRGFLSGPERLSFSSPAHPDVSVILVLFEQAELTFGCLTALAEAIAVSGIGVEVVVLENSSSDLTSSLLDRADGLKILRSPENLHFLRGANRAAGAAIGRTLLFLNNDAQIAPGAIEAALRTLAASPDIGAVGGRILLPDGSLQEAGSIIWRDGSCLGYGRGGRPYDPQFMFQRDVDYCSGVFLLTPADLFRRLGGFDERYAPAYYEDADYCVCLQEKGFRVVYDPEVLVHHHEYGSATDESAPRALMERNRERFVARHDSWLKHQLAPAPDRVLPARHARGDATRILVIDDKVPRATLGAGFPRANDVLRALVRHGGQVTFFPTDQETQAWSDVRGSVPPSVEVMKDSNSAGLRAFLRERWDFYDAVLVSRPHNMRAFLSAVEPDRLSSGPMIAYDAEAVFAQREITKAALFGRPVPIEEAQRRVAQEIALAKPASVVFCVSESERRVFHEHGISNVFLLGHSLEPQPTGSPFSERSDVLFLGAMHDDDSPNADSVRWFAHDVLPRLREILGRPIRLKVVGLNHAPSIEALDREEIDLVGPVEDLAPVLEAARLAVIPTRYAAGLPHKAHQLASRGVPMVTTPLIGNQLGWRDGEEVLVSGNAPGFAEACARLYRDEDLWHRLRGAALARSAADCSPERFAGTIRRFVSSVPRRRSPGRVYGGRSWPAGPLQTPPP